MSEKWLQWAMKIQSIAQAGLTFSKDAFDKERFEELQELSAEIMAEHTNHEMKQILNLFSQEKGYQTPKVDVRGAVFRGNEILMVRENVDQRWALPGGFCDVGISPAENAIKEIQEESGYITVPKKLLALLDYHNHPHPPQPFHYYKIFIQCEIIGGMAEKGMETNDVQFFSLNSLPDLSTSRNTESQIAMLFEFLQNPTKETVFD
ncbi:NUDIX hydrolase [Thalassobacillus hwangdonensis]|uniref:NUDIX hydrolase n=1 Tax=Thalassobacillus hwangdonensis TaxID=546108 RepID=A0ABW3L0B0_9BACI